MNRRSFLQAAALSAVAVTKGRAQERLPRITDSEVPVEIDLADPSAGEYLQGSATDVFVRLEEQFPADPGELSGAKLTILGAGDQVSLHVSIGDVLQPTGYRTSHWLAYLNADGVRRLAGLDPVNGERESAFFLQDPDREAALGAACLVLHPGASPNLFLCISTYCLGVLRGELVERFLQCLRLRAGVNEGGRGR